MSGNAGDQFAHHAAAVARDLLGEENKQLSKPDELRFGKQGSISVALKTGQFFDHQENEGGGVLWFIERQTGQTVAGGKAVQWMRDNGFDIEDNRPQRPADDRPAVRLDPAGNWLPQRVPDHGRLTKSYDYKDEDGRLAYQVCRYDWTVDPSVNPKGHDKTFVQRVPDSSKKNGWTYSTKGIRWLPYRLQELREDIAAGLPIFIVEGEKKVDMLRELGVAATCNHGGAGKFPEELVDHFAGAEVIILPDNDQAGKDHAGLIARRLDGTAKRVTMLEIPGLPEKGGVDDWLPNGGSAEELYDLVADMSKPVEAAPFVSRFAAVEWRDLDAPGPRHEYLIKDTLTRHEMSMLLGESQSGKSFLAIDIAMAVARGEDWFGHRVKRGGVIYQAGESASGVRRKRLPAYRIGKDLYEKDLPFVLLQGPLDLYSSDDPTEAFIDECRYWGRRFGEAAPLELIVIDTFNRATPGANENDGRDMGMVLARGERIRRETGAHVMFVHHLNSGGTKARGHTSLFANVENVISVTRILDTHDSEGRQIRSWKVAKQKDGEDGREKRFVLRGVQIGEDEEGDAVFSCIVGDPQRGEGEQEAADAGTQISGNNATMLRAIYTGVAQKGVLAPKELGLGQGAMAVPREELWAICRAAFDADAPIARSEIRDGETEADAKKRRDGAFRQTVKRAREHLFSRAIIGQSADGWTWLTGKTVRGFEQAPGLSDADRDARDRRRKRRKENREADQPPPPPPMDDVPFGIDEGFSG